LADLILKAIKIVVVLLVIAFATLQVFQVDRTNPPIIEAETLAAAVNVPENVQAIFDRSCNDCHSNNTVYPWYSKVQPSGWFVKDHIDDGRRHLNFSVFNTYEQKRKVKKLEEICEQVESKEMPLPSYLWLHRDAAMRDGEAKILCDWAEKEKNAISG
jgi:hypothetical protein